MRLQGEARREWNTILICNRINYEKSPEGAKPRIEL
jgi:hypothetical protein